MFSNCSDKGHEVPIFKTYLKGIIEIKKNKNWQHYFLSNQQKSTALGVTLRFTASPFYKFKGLVFTESVVFLLVLLIHTRTLSHTLMMHSEEGRENEGGEVMAVGWGGGGDGKVEVVLKSVRT